MRTRWLLAVVAAAGTWVVAGAPVGAATATASSTVQLVGTGAASTVNEAELFDIKQVAKDRGIPLAQAIKELAGQDEFAAFATEAAERFPDEFSFARYDSGAASLGVKGTLSTSMTQLARALPFDVSVAQNVGWSEREIKAAGEAVHAAARAAAPGVSISTDIDTRTGQVTVATSAAASGARVSPTVLAGSDAVRAAGARLPAGAKLTFISDTAEGGFYTVYGGGSLSTCTAAFSVSSPSYAHGLLTAEHCGNSQAYSGRSVLTFRAALSKSLGDAQWHSSSEGANPYFYYTSGSLRAITSTANAVPGQSLCKYGKTTSNTCDTVYKTAQCRDAYCNLIMMNRRKADSGDSGGPWYWGNAGYGIHSGWKTYLLINRDMYTPVRSTAAGLGLTVKLQ